jgi:serine O-acetyltransferase
MIRTKSDYHYYLEADRIALAKPDKKSRSVYSSISSFLFPDYIWKFQKTLRKLEYLKNNKNNYFNKLVYFFVLKRYYHLSYKLGFTIPVNVFGPGLSIAHYGTIIINVGAKIGSNCRIHADVNIGTEAGHSNKAPVLGDNIYIGPGAKLFGAITIANNTIIGANAVVNRSFEEQNTAVAGVPAKKILENIDINDVLIRATHLIDNGVNTTTIAGMSSKELKEYLIEKAATKNK